MTDDTQTMAAYAALVLQLREVLGLQPGRSTPAHIVVAVQDLVARNDRSPCQSCGADPSVSPATGDELPIIRGALDAQASAEKETFAARAEIARLRAAVDRDQTGLAEAMNDIRRSIQGWSWLGEPGSWGSYEYQEHTLETLRTEIRGCLTAINAIARSALATSGDLAQQTLGFPTSLSTDDAGGDPCSDQADPSAPSVAAVLEEFYLLDTRGAVGNCASWWCPDGKGYTCELDKAGLYFRDDAIQNRGTDVPVPRSLAETLAIRHVRIDMLRDHIDIRGYEQATRQERVAWCAAQKRKP